MDVPVTTMAGERGEAPVRLATAWASRGPVRGASLLLASSISVQSGAALATTMFATIGPGETAAAGFAIAGLLLLVVHRPRVIAWPRRRWRDILLLGLVMAAGTICFLSALDHLPLGTTVTIQFLGPLSLALFGARKASHLVAAGLALAGVTLVSSATPSADLAGLGLAFASAGVWAAYIIMMRRTSRWSDTGENLTVAICVAAIVSSPLSIAALPDIVGGSLALPLLGVALLSFLVPYTLEIEALGQLPASTAGIIFSAEPAIGAMVGAIALGQQIAFGQMLGILAVVAAGLLALRDSVQPPGTP